MLDMFLMVLSWIKYKHQRIINYRCPKCVWQSTGKHWTQILLQTHTCDGTL